MLCILFFTAVDAASMGVNRKQNADAYEVKGQYRKEKTMCRVNKYELICEKVTGYNTDIIDKAMNSADNIARFITQTLQSDRLTTEHFWVFMLDTRMKVVGFSDISIGSLNMSPVHPREVFQIAISTAKVAAVIVAHNHPSGDPAPSLEDMMITDRLVDAGKLLGIPVLDHIIAGDGCWTSLKEQGYIE